MPIKFRAISVSESLNRKHNDIDVRVAEATGVLLQAIDTISRLAKPKNLTVTGCYLRRFEQVTSDESMHTIRIAEWQILATIQNRVVNVIAHGVFHSGGRSLFINGKSIYIRPELGGVSLDDIWQDSNKWKEFYNAVGKYEIKVPG